MELLLKTYSEGTKCSCTRVEFEDFNVAHQRQYPLLAPFVLAHLSDRGLQVYAEGQQEQNLNVLLYFVFTLTLLTLYNHCCTAASFVSEPIIL